MGPGGFGGGPGGRGGPGRMEDEKRDSSWGEDWALLKRFVALTKRIRRPLLMVYALYFMNSLFNLIPATSMRYFFDGIVNPGPISFFGFAFDTREYFPSRDDQVWGAVIYLGCVLFLILVANLIGVIMWRASTRVRQNMILDIKKRVHRHLQKLSISYFDSERTGTIMSRTVGDVEQMEQMLRQSFELLYGFIHLLMVPVIMLGMSPLLFLVALVPVPVIFFTIRRIRKELRPLYHKMREQQASIGATIQEHITGIREIKAFGQEDATHREYTRANLGLVRTVYDSVRVFSVNHQVLHGTREAAMILIGVGGGIMAMTGTGNVTLGIVIAFLPLMGQFFDPIRMLVGFYDIIQRGLASAERVFAFLDIEPEVQDRPEAVDAELKDGAISFENVTFGYAADKPVVHEVSFNIIPGQKVAIVGSTGAGKTTLVSLLMRFYQPQSGRIMIDGHDISEITQSSLHDALGMVFQETLLFYGSMRQNIAFSRPNATFEEIQEAARLASIDKFIESLPDGYDTLVGERGVKLSGGQRQRMAIARMILKDPAIVILDEATSSVDTHTERAIQKSLDKLIEGRTAIVIAHRLSTIRNADVVLTMENGKLVEAGSPEDLLKQKGRYASLVEAASL